MDSTYAPAYTGLAWIVYAKYWKFNRSQILGDSVLKLLNKALFYDDQLAEAYNLRGNYYNYITGEKEKALGEYNMALKFNPNLWTTLMNKALYYFSTDLPKAIEYLHQAIWRNQGLEDTNAILHWLIMMYKSADFLDKAEYYNEQRLKLNRDSAQYFDYLYRLEYDRGNRDKAIEFCNKTLALDSTKLFALIYLGQIYLISGEYEKSLEILEKYIEKRKASGKQPSFQDVIGYAYWKNGDLELADYYIELGLEGVNRIIEQRRSPFALQFRAGLFAFQGKKDEALADLREYYDSEGIHYDNLYWLKRSPLFDNLRDDLEFQQILHSIETKCQAEHERVRKWLEENEML